MFCDNPKCKLHIFDDTDQKIEVFETNPGYFMTGGQASGTRSYGNHRIVDQVTKEEYNLCEVCMGVVLKTKDMREAHANLPPLARAVAEAVNEEER